MSLEVVALDVVRSLSQLLTGKLMTDGQIRAVTGNVVGRYFSDWLARPQDEKKLESRVDAARNHLRQATEIIVSLKDDLDAQARQLDGVATELARKKAEADRYAALARLNQESFAPIREELQESLRTELEVQARKGRRLRQAVAFLVWLITLVLGAYLPKIVDWSRERLAAPAIQRRSEPREVPTLPSSTQTKFEPMLLKQSTAA